MGAVPQPAKAHSPRRAILDLAPLELECMNALWPLGEATVRQIQQALAPTCPRAYTTIMTIMDRLAQKEVVTRRKAGRAYLYQPTLTAEQARAHAIELVVKGFFHGSAAELEAHVAGSSPDAASWPHGRTERRGNGEQRLPAPEAKRSPGETPAEDMDEFAQPAEILPAARLDESLL